MNERSSISAVEGVVAVNTVLSAVSVYDSRDRRKLRWRLTAVAVGEAIVDVAATQDGPA